MHGRPRVSANAPVDKVKAAEKAKKLQLYSKVLAAVVAARKAKDYNEKALASSALLLSKNPEVYTLWNYRKEALEKVLEAGGDAAKAASEGELKLTEGALRENPKSYAAWHHRKWVVLNGVVDLDAELVLVNRFLKLDGRNFHGWNYRYFLADQMKLSPEDELEYTHEKIQESFSNYSAWHYRTVLLPKVHAARGGGATLEQLVASAPSGGEGTEAAPASHVSDPTSAPGPIPMPVLNEEFDFVRSAMWVDPKDQSAWLYHRWLLGQSLAHAEAAPSDDAKASARHALVERLGKEIAAMRELLTTLRAEGDGASDDIKWPALTLARLLEAAKGLGAEGAELVAGGDDNDSDADALYTELAQIDPMREGHYRAAAAGDACVSAMRGATTVTM